MAKTVAVTPELQNLMEEYYKFEVFADKEDRDANYDFADETIRELLDYVSTVDDRFDDEVTMYGSYCQKLFDRSVQEFKYAIRLNVPDIVKWITTQDPVYTLRTYGFNKAPRSDMDTAGRSLMGGPLKTVPADIGVAKSIMVLPIPEYSYGNVELPYGDPKWKDFIMDGDIVPFLVKQRFQKLLKEARLALGMEDIVTISEKVDGACFNLELTKKKKPKKMNVEIGIMIEMKMKFHSWMTWPRKNAKWPDSSKAKKVLEKGINLKANGNFYWRESFAEARTELIKDIDADNGLRKRVFCIVKHLNSEHWVTGNDSDLSSRDIKNMWLWLIESKSETVNWTKFQLAVRVVDLVALLLRACRTITLPHYFDQRRNMFAKKNSIHLLKIAGKLQAFLEEPKKYFQNA